MKKTLVLGASDHPSRYSYIAINRLREEGHPVVAIGKKNTTVRDVKVENQPQQFIDIDTVTLYLNPANQIPFYNYIISLRPKRIIFNPGSENQELSDLASKKGILTLEACTLVLLSTRQY